MLSLETGCAVNLPLPPPDVDPGCGFWCAANFPPPDVFHQLEGRNPLQLRQRTCHRHLLSRTKETQAHNHYYNYDYFCPNCT